MCKGSGIFRSFFGGSTLKSTATAYYCCGTIGLVGGNFSRELAKKHAAAAYWERLKTVTKVKFQFLVTQNFNVFWFFIFMIPEFSYVPETSEITC